MDANKQPIPEVEVLVRALDSGSAEGDAITDTDGSYTIKGMSAGNYVVETNPDNTNFLDAYYDNVLEFDDVIPVKETQPAETSGIDFQLELGGTISGIVLDPSNQPIAEVSVYVLDLNGSFSGNAETCMDSRYIIIGLSSGNFRARTNTYNTNFIDAVYHNVLDFDEATSVSVTQRQRLQL